MQSLSSLVCNAMYGAAPVLKILPANAGDVRDVDSIPGSGRSPGEDMAAHSSILA